MTNTSELREYGRMLGEWPGLISRGERERVDQLVEDSLTVLPHLREVETVVDVGSGGGMPGIPLRIVRAGLRMTLIESDARKAAFLVHAAAELGIEVVVLTERAESVARGSAREGFDAALSRALASMPVVAELCLPLVRVGGRMLAMKGEQVLAGELDDCRAAVALLGGGEPIVHPAPSAARPGGVIVEVAKLAPTPDAYPRRPGIPARRPLTGSNVE